MKDFKGGIAVVTGAASGIGRALAGRFAQEGMRLAIADVEQEALDKAVAELEADGAEVLGVRTDVSDRSSVDAFAAAVADRLGPATILCNNAGVSGGGGGLPVWETSDNDWAWTLGVNLMGVIHGIQAFVPAMVDSGRPGHVVNTSSILGLATGGGGVTYGVSKHAVTRLSEGLWYDLQTAGSRIGVSVLCPGLIATNIITSARNRPAHLQSDAFAGADEVELQARMKAIDSFFKENGMRPEMVADIVLDAIRNDVFYVLTHPELLDRVEQRFRAILDGTNPPPPTTALNLGGQSS